MKRRGEIRATPRRTIIFSYRNSKRKKMKLHVPKEEGVPLSESNKRDDSTEEPKESKSVRVVPASNSLTAFQT